MDTYDYKRLRTQPLQEEREKKILHLGLAFDDMRQRGILRLVDYSNYYSRDTQQEYLQKNQQLLAAMPNWLRQRTAKNGAIGFAEYSRGSYQEPGRVSLGEDRDAFSDGRQSAKGQSQRMETGLGNYTGWTEKFLNKCVTALVVCDNLNRNSNLNVSQIIGGPEYHMVGDLVNAARLHPCNGTTIDILNAGCGVIDADVSYLEELQPNDRVKGLNPKMVAQTREALDTVGEIATKVAGVQYDGWHILGTTFALPKHQKLFNYENIRTEVCVEMDEERLAEETMYVLTRLEQRDGVNYSQSKRQYLAEYITEQYDTISPKSPIGGTDIVDCALNMSDKSQELWSLRDRGDISQTAIFLATCITNNPIRRYNENDVYQRAVDLINRINPSPAWQNRVEKFRQEEQVETYMDHDDWYEKTHQER